MSIKQTPNNECLFNICCSPFLGNSRKCLTYVYGRHASLILCHTNGANKLETVRESIGYQWNHLSEKRTICPRKKAFVKKELFFEKRTIF